MRTGRNPFALRLTAAIVALTVASLGATLVRAETLGDCEPQDAGASAGTAREVTLPVACRGDLSAAADSADFYSINLIAGQVITVAVSADPPLVATGLAMFKPDNTTRVPATANPGAPSGTGPRSFGCADNVNTRDVCVVRADVSGLWKIGITREVGAGTYQLIADASARQNDCGAGRDAADAHVASPTLAIELPVNDPPDAGLTRSVSCSAAFDDDDFSDVFLFEAYETMRIYADVLPSAGATAAVELIDPLGRVLTNERISSDPGVDLVHQAKMSGIFGFRVARGQRSGGYSISIAVEQRDCNAVIGSDGPSGTPAPITGSCKATLDGRPLGGELGNAAADDVDRFVFPSETPSSVNVAIGAPPTACVRMTLTDPHGASRSPVSVCNGGSAGVSGGSITGGWVIQVDRVQGNGTYALTIDGTVAPQIDCGAEGDASADPATPRHFGVAGSTPTAVVWSGSCKGDLRPSSDVDQLSFTAVRGGAVTISLGETPPTGLTVCLTKPNTSGCQPLVSKVAADQAGTWALRVSTSSGSAQRYEIDVTMVVTNDCGIGWDAGDIQSQAAPVTQPRVCGQAQPGTALHVPGDFNHPTLDTVDWYRFEASDISGFAFAVHPVVATMNLELCVISPYSPTPRCENAGGAGAAESLTYHACDVPPGIRIPFKPCGGLGTWYVQVKQLAPNASGNYRLAIVGKD